VTPFHHLSGDSHHHSSIGAGPITASKQALRNEAQVGAAARARGNATDARAAELDAVTDCARFLTVGIKSGSFLKTDVLVKAGCKLDESNACRIAKALGFRSKAEATSIPRVN
jgi:hypothetical protein